MHGEQMRKFRVNSSRREFLYTATMAAGAGLMVHARPSWASNTIDASMTDIVAKTIGIDTHNHIDVPLSTAEMPGPDIDLKGEIKRSGLSATCMTFATDYQAGDAYERFKIGLASTDRQLELNGLKRSLTSAHIRASHSAGQPAVIQAIEGGHFLDGHLERVEEAYLKTGFTSEEIGKIGGGNFLRIFGEAVGG